MNILLLGSGGREHALAWKMKQSKLCNELYIAPGNAGTSLCGENIQLVLNDFYSIKKICCDEQIDIVVVGPEEPLVNGIYDYLTHKQDEKFSKEWKGIVIGPSAASARLEGSKSFSKQFMQRYNIPTAAYAEFNEYTFNDGKNYITNCSLPVVLKADGLAAGKGVIICTSHREALYTFEEMVINKQFGKASAKVVVEEYLQGVELSAFVLTDGIDYKIIGHAKDYKRIGEGDTGPNTGGMGCVTPVPFADDIFMKKVEERIIKPTIRGLHAEALVYKGFLFFGLMNVNGEPFVIEYNCRMGDPETEVVLLRLKNDLVEMFEKLNKGELKKVSVEFNDIAVATVMAVSGGYPGGYNKGSIINFETRTDFKNEQLSGDIIPAEIFQPHESVLIFHAGTKKQDNKIVTDGGRVLAVTGVGKSITEAVNRSKEALKHVHFDGIYFRNDIGYEFE